MNRLIGLHLVDINSTLVQDKLMYTIVVWWTVKEQMHPYHYRQTKELLEGFTVKIEILSMFLSPWIRPHIFSKIIFSDEATLTRNGVFNMHNKRSQADENINAIKITHYQQS